MLRFSGAKLAILSGQSIVTILRDDIPTIPWPGHWDLPGGARDGDETPEDCVLREVREELGITLADTALHWRKETRTHHGRRAWFFVSKQPDFDPKSVIFGNEGQTWRLAPLDWFLNEAKAIPHHRDIVKSYLNQSLDR